MAKRDSTGRVLVADDEESLRWVIQQALEAEGHEVVAVASGDEAWQALQSDDFDVAVLDIRMPGLAGLDVLSRVRDAGQQTLCLVMTAQGTMANAIEATKRGAFDYLPKPFELEQLQHLVRRALEQRRMLRDVERLRGELLEQHDFLAGSAPVMQEVFKTIGRVAPTDATVLLQGETGTGKELVAKTIHLHSGRTGSFLAINCSAIPADLLESELFGYERGAFTGAVERRAGKFELAAGGTLFLDEIGDLPLALQGKLLRVLQEREFTRLGGRDALATDVRIIAATNRDLETAMRRGAFREDLYFRLNVVRIVLPPLRERKSDIPSLIDFFVAKMNRHLGMRVAGVNPEARSLLAKHDWPGNVRELENALVRAAVLAGGGRSLLSEDFDLAKTAPAPGPNPPLGAAVRSRTVEVMAAAGERPRDVYETILREIEAPLLRVVLERTGGNQLRAAEILGINRNTLRKKLTELGISPAADGDSGAHHDS
jgi:two-component system nitrogen regulation response regulator GlnG